MYNSLQSIYYNKDTISYNDIHAFNTSIRSKNDSNNKKRENIIGCIINDKITCIGADARAVSSCL